MRVYIGLDMHKNYLQAAVLEAEGQLVKEQRIDNSKEEITDFFQPYERSRVVIESSTTWYPIYQLLSSRHEVTLSNPAKTRAIAQAKVKTGKIDALTLAKLLRGGFIAESYIPPSNIMDIRHYPAWETGSVESNRVVCITAHEVWKYCGDVRGIPGLLQSGHNN